jgi:hypothetical protein
LRYPLRQKQPALADIGNRTFTCLCEADGRLSLLSLGMKQLELPDLLLVAPSGKADKALPKLYGLLAYVVSADRYPMATPSGARRPRSLPSTMCRRQSTRR